MYRHKIPTMYYLFWYTSRGFLQSSQHESIHGVGNSVIVIVMLSNDDDDDEVTSGSYKKCAMCTTRQLSASWYRATTITLSPGDSDNAEAGTAPTITMTTTTMMHNNDYGHDTRYDDTEQPRCQPTMIMTLTTTAMRDGQFQLQCTMYNYDAD
jgi:hypothetical protein